MKTLHELCNRFRHRYRGIALWLGALQLLVFVIFFLLIHVAVDRQLEFSRGARLAGFLLLALGFAALVHTQLLRPLRRHWTDKEVLDYLDRVLPGSSDSLITLQELSDGKGSQEVKSATSQRIVRQAVEQLTPFVATVAPTAALNSQPLWSWRKRALGAVALLAVACILAGPTVAIGLQRLVFPWASIRYPHRTQITMMTPEHGWHVAKGDPLTIRARIDGVIPRDIELWHRGEGQRRWIKEFMGPGEQGNDGLACAFTLTEVPGPLEFYIAAGDDRTDTYQLTVVERPEITRIQTTYFFPPYAHVPPKITDSGQLSGLEGTKVNIRFTSSKRLQRVTLARRSSEGAAASGPAPVPARRVNMPMEGEDVPLDSPTTFHVDMILKDSGSYTISLLDEDGLREGAPETYLMNVVPDNPPTVSLLVPGKDIIATDRAKPLVTFQVADDFGLKRVQFLYRPEGGEAVELSDHITGPISQTGKKSGGSFPWPIDKLGLKNVKSIEYWIKATDLNPTGRGVTESEAQRITVLSPEDYQAEILLQAKTLAVEATIGHRNQVYAYFDAQYWLAGSSEQKGSPKLLDQVLNEQDGAVRSARALLARLAPLKTAIEENGLHVEFMYPRLTAIEKQIHTLLDGRLKTIADSLQQARPRVGTEVTSAENAVAMQAKLSQAEREQHYAALEFRRLVHQITDWLDLQNVYVKTTKMAVAQVEVNTRTQAITTEFIGREIEDLADKDSARLTVLAQRQRTLYQAETALENELVELIAKSETEGRKKTYVALMGVFKALRENLVNDKLRRSAEAIGKNTGDTIIDDQKTLARSFKVINDSLVKAGQDLPETGAVQLVALSDDRIQDVVKVTAKPVRKEGEAFNPADVLAAALHIEVEKNTVEAFLKDMVELQEDVRQRTRYLAGGLNERERSPRYRSLKLAMLSLKQEQVIAAADRARELAGKYDFQPLASHLDELRAAAAAVLALLAQGDVSRFNQELQEEIVENLQLTRRFLYDRSKEKIRVAQRLENKGRDEFARRFLLADRNIETAFKVYESLGWARVLQADVSGKCERLGRTDENRTALHDKINDQRHRLTLAKQQQVQRLLVDAARLARDIQPYDNLEENLRRPENDPAKRVADEVIAGLPLKALEDLAQKTAKRPFAAELAKEQQALQASLVAAAERITALTDVRMAENPPPPGAEDAVRKELAQLAQGDAGASEAKIRKISEAMMQDFQPATIIEKIENSKLPEDSKKRLIASLSKVRNEGFDRKYQLLLGAYFTAVLEKEAKAPPQPANPDSGK